jgi:hypothetical protein
MKNVVALHAAIKTLTMQNRVNLVKLSDLRTYTALDREAFNEALEVLRDQQKVVLQSHDGRHSLLSVEDREACIQEAGRTFAYACIRE